VTQTAWWKADNAEPLVMKVGSGGEVGLTRCAGAGNEQNPSKDRAQLKRVLLVAISWWPNRAGALMGIMLILMSPLVFRDGSLTQVPGTISEFHALYHFSGLTRRMT